jgi:acyl carrier protein phosphodiesterase
MNFLAHAYLAEGSDESIVASLMGDFVKGPLDARHGAGIARGLTLHRRIDTYTDAHPVVARSRARVSPERRRYAGVLLDLFYDHFLARHWADYSDLPLEGFTARVYAALRSSHALLPERLQLIAPRMAATDWLASYRHVDAVGALLDPWASGSSAATLCWARARSSPRITTASRQTSGRSFPTWFGLRGVRDER